MPKIRCEFCHQQVDKDDYSAHIKPHLELRADGQQTDYVTLPPEERDEGELFDVPRVYVHRRCGKATQMPEEIIRSYLNNPYLYFSDKTFCAGCGKHIAQKECFWTETGQNLQEYINKLRAQKPEMRPNLLIRILASAVRPFIS